MNRQSLQDVLNQEKIMIIDGSMATGLELKGYDLNQSLWTASALVNKPEWVKQVHMDYFKAGADCGITDSYQASIPGLMAKGYSESEAEALITKSVTLFCEARQQWWEEEGKASERVYPLCLGAVGSYGAYLADGSEYRGKYGVDEETLIQFHKRRMELLWKAGADLLIIETQPSLTEALIEAKLAEELGATYWISFTCKDGKHTHEGQTIEECAKALSGLPHLAMVGINCTDPKYVESLILEWKKYTNLPIGVYPNSGETYDPLTKTWHGPTQPIPYENWAEIWMKAGASAVGGCCQTGVDHIKQVVRTRNRFLSKQ